MARFADRARTLSVFCSRPLTQQWMCRLNFPCLAYVRCLSLRALVIFVFTPFVAITALTFQAQAEEDSTLPVLLPLYHYKPIYFLAGNPYEKIQISFRTNLVKDTPLYFGYTQLAMWDALINHPAFYDLNYNPDLFYRMVTSRENMQWLDFGFFEHESNGKGIDGEKSWNRVYLRYHDRTKLGETMHLEWDVKVWYALNYNDTNQDLQRYRGIYELEVMLSQIFPRSLDQGDITLRLYPGGPSTVDPLRGGQELTFRTKVRWSPILPLVMAQVFHGYGESLTDYKIDRWGIRAGFGF